jgi:hypothetical protein
MLETLHEEIKEESPTPIREKESKDDEPIIAEDVKTISYNTNKELFDEIKKQEKSDHVP